MESIRTGHKNRIARESVDGVETLYDWSSTLGKENVRQLGWYTV